MLKQGSGLMSLKEFLKNTSPLAKEKNEAMDRIFQRVDEETGMLPVYHRIIDTANVPVIPLEELTAEARSRLELIDFEYAYDAPLDKIVYRRKTPREELSNVLIGRLTRTGALAHESLHKIQSDADPTLPLVRFVFREGYVVDGQLDLSRVDYRRTGEFLSIRDANRRDVERYLLNTLRTNSEKLIIFEISARFLTPQTSLRNGEIAFDILPSILRQFNFDVFTVPAIVTATMVVYGHYRDSPDVDVAVHRFIGQNGTSLQSYMNSVQALGDVQAKIQRGQQFIKERSDAFECIPRIVDEVLAAYR